MQVSYFCNGLHGPFSLVFEVVGPVTLKTYMHLKGYHLLVTINSKFHSPLPFPGTYTPPWLTLKVKKKGQEPLHILFNCSISYYEKTLLCNYDNVGNGQKHNLKTHLASEGRRGEVI